MSWHRQRTQRSASCTKRLTELRKARNLTQEELARIAGYSLRLICKAESGKSVAVATIRDIAEALSIDNELVTLEDLISDPLEIAKQFVFGMYKYEAEVVTQLSDIVHDDIVSIFAGSQPSIPFAGKSCGREAVDQAFRTFFQFLQTPEGHQPEEHYEFLSDDNRVVCWGASWFHPRGQAELSSPVSVSILMQFTDGKLILFDDRFNTEDGAKIMKDFLDKK